MNKESQLLDGILEKSLGTDVREDVGGDIYKIATSLHNIPQRRTMPDHSPQPDSHFPIPMLPNLLLLLLPSLYYSPAPARIVPQFYGYDAEAEGTY
jgi:hypothetical protein